MTKMTPAQRYMAEFIRDNGPLDVTDMARFGRQWPRVWRALVDSGIGVFKINGRDSRCYDVWGEYGNNSPRA